MNFSKFVKLMKDMKFIIVWGGGFSLSYVGPPRASQNLP